MTSLILVSPHLPPARHSAERRGRSAVATIDDVIDTRRRL